MGKTERDMINCVHPLIFNNDSACYPYSMVGTGFLVEFNHHLFFITALHCLRNYEYTSKQLMIIPSSGSKDVIHFDREYVGRSLIPDDSDRADLLILHADIRNTPSKVLQGVSPFRMTNMTSGVPGGSPDLKYRLYGYPGNSSDVNYDTYEITGRSVTLNLQYNGSDTNMTHVHRFKYSKEDCTNPNGLSGSPVFGTTVLDNKQNLTQLIGLVIRGGNGNIYALDSLVVATAIFNSAKRENERNEST